MHQSSLNSHKNKGHSPFFFPPIMRSSVGQCRNIRFRQLSASHVIITSDLYQRYSNNLFWVVSIAQSVEVTDSAVLGGVAEVVSSNPSWAIKIFFSIFRHS